MSKTQTSFYQALIDSLVDYAICFLDVDGNIVSWNPGAVRTTGYPAEEMLGRHYRLLFTDEDREEGMPERTLRDAVEHGHVEVEAWRRRKDGGRYWANTIIDVVVPMDDMPHGFAVIARDLTGKKITEDNLRRSEEQFRLLIQGVGDCAIFMIDREGFITSWNTGAQRIKGYTRDEVLGKHLSTFYSLQDQADGVPAKALAIATETGRFESEGWRVRKDGTSFWAHAILDRIDNDDGQHIGFAKITRDITAKRDADLELAAAREALFQSQKLEAVGQLTGGVAHDFNNLLMAVIGSLELLESHVGDSEVQRNLVANALAGAKRGAALTRRMLAFARKQELKPTSIDVKALIVGISDLLQRSAGPTITIDTVFPLTVRNILIDSNQLELALLNLVMNSRDAMPNGGHIIIAARNETIDQVPHRTGLPVGHYVSLAVTDEGIGMDAATLAKAIEPFFTTKGVGKGTGLGLSMVHGLAEQSGGRLALRSEPSHGTTADLWLPVAEEISQPAATSDDITTPVTSCARPLTILLVDDDPLIAMTMNAVLSDIGHRIIEVHTATEAQDRLDAVDDIDLLITDYAMPGMNGLQLASAARATRPGLPIILASGYAEFPAGTAADVVRLAKPFGRRELLEVIDRMALCSSP